jgi:hypothetical protein
LLSSLLTSWFSPSLVYYRYRYHEATIADGIIEQIRPYVHEILRIVLDVKGRNLRELNELLYLRVWLGCLILMDCLERERVTLVKAKINVLLLCAPFCASFVVAPCIPTKVLRAESCLGPRLALFLVC